MNSTFAKALKDGPIAIGLLAAWVSWLTIQHVEHSQATHSVTTESVESICDRLDRIETIQDEIRADVKDLLRRNP